MKEQETVCSLHTAPPSVTSANATIEKAELSEPGVSITNVPPNPTTEQECNFEMGKCLIHKLKGTKNIIKNRKCVKKKDGTFGYTTVRSIIYTCTAKKEGRIEPLISTVNLDQSQLPTD